MIVANGWYWSVVGEWVVPKVWKETPYVQLSCRQLPMCLLHSRSCTAESRGIMSNDASWLTLIDYVLYDNYISSRHITIRLALRGVCPCAQRTHTALTGHDWHDILLDLVWGKTRTVLAGADVAHGCTNISILQRGKRLQWEILTFHIWWRITTYSRLMWW